MKKRQNLFWSAFALACGLLVLSGCEETEIPTTPEAPFDNTGIVFTNNSGRSLTGNTSVRFDVEIAFTLSAPHATNRPSIAIGVDYYCRDANEAIIDLGTAVDKVFSPLSDIKGILTDSQTFPIPAQARTFGAVVVLVDTSQPPESSLLGLDEFEF